MSSQASVVRAAIARAHRRHAPADELTCLYQDLAEAKIAQYAKEIVDRAPPLTQDQRDRIAALLVKSEVDVAA